MTTFKAFRVELNDGVASTGIQDCHVDDLPIGDVLIRVNY